MADGGAVDSGEVGERFRVANPNDNDGDDVREQNVEVQSAPIGCKNMEVDEPTLLPTPKPLKSILKRRRPEENSSNDAETKGDEGILVEKPKFGGGSITQALKMITGIAQASDDEDDGEPKPSAFILEMEKQKDKLPIPVPGALSFPNRLEGIDVVDMDWGDTSAPQEPNSFFLQEQKRQKEKKLKRQKQKLGNNAPKQTAKNKANTGSMMKTPHEIFIQCIVMINNLPFKVTVEELIRVLGVWPKGGYTGIKLITDNAGLPAGYAYVVLERHSDMMDVIRLTGLEMQGRKIRVSMSNRKNLIEDWKITKKALIMIEKSRVVKVNHLPYTLTKAELIDTIKHVRLKEDDVYWSPLRLGQQNSGRGFVILQSSNDAKAVAGKKYVAEGKHMGRTIEVTQVHPLDMQRFCAQCKLEIREDHKLTDPLPEDCDDVSDLCLDPDLDSNSTFKTRNAQDINSAVTYNLEETTHIGTSQSQKVLVEKESDIKRKKSKRRCSRDQDMQIHAFLPPFLPTVYVRMYNVPDKATTSDIRNFFDPILPAKVAQNLGYDIYDIEFYRPEDAMKSMQKHNLLMRKNIIALEMLPGPPNPLPPRPFPSPRTRSPNLGQMQAPGIELIPPGVGPGALPPGTMPRPFSPNFRPSPMLRGVIPPMFSAMPPRPIIPGPMIRLPGIGPKPPVQGGPMMLGPCPVGPVHRSGIQNISPGIKVPKMQGTGRLPKVTESQFAVPSMSAGEQSRTEIQIQSSYEASAFPAPEDYTKPKKELIPVPPLPADFTKYALPPFDKDAPVGQALITTMQGYFCQLCNKFYSSLSSAKEVHCKTKGHYDRLKHFLREKRRLRKLAEVESKQR